MTPTSNNKEIELSKELGMTAEQLAIITNSIAKNATPNELRYFLTVAKRTGLDPLSKQIHFVKRRSKKQDGSYEDIATIQTGIDGYRAIAERSGTLAGIDDVIFDTEDAEHPKKATVTVYKMINGIRVSFTASARWSEYAQSKTDYKTKASTPMGLWAKMPYLMLGKCAEALALRKAFPHDLSGLYTHEEMQQAENEPKNDIQTPDSFAASPAKPAPVSTITPEPDKTTTPNNENATDGEFEPCESEQEPEPEPKEFFCARTGEPITEQEYNYSMRFYKQPLSRAAQAEVRAERKAAQANQ